MSLMIGDETEDDDGDDYSVDEDVVSASFRIITWIHTHTYIYIYIWLMPLPISQGHGVQSAVGLWVCPPAQTIPFGNFT